jgi:hypothetical protein
VIIAILLLAILTWERLTWLDQSNQVAAAATLVIAFFESDGNDDDSQMKQKKMKPKQE